MDFAKGESHFFQDGSRSWRMINPHYIQASKRRQATSPDFHDFGSESLWGPMGASGDSLVKSGKAWGGFGGPRWSPDGPRWSQDGPRWSQDGPRWPKMEPGWPKMWARRAQKKEDSRTKRSLYTLTPDHPALLAPCIINQRLYIRYCIWNYTNDRLRIT